jgi:hypothetical protein
MILRRKKAAAARARRLASSEQRSGVVFAFTSRDQRRLSMQRRRTMERNRMSRFRGTPVLAVLALLPLWACSSASGADSQGASPGDLCSSVGTKMKQCDSTVDEPTAVASCNNQLAAVVPKLRSDVVSSLESCVQSSDCAHLSTFVKDCLDTARSSIAPSARATTLCSDIAKAEMTCNSTATTDESQCLDAAKIFTDSALSAADGCASHACADIASCLTSMLGGS